MGNWISRLLTRLLDPPLRRKPLCFYRQKDYNYCGELLKKDDTQIKVPQTEYDKLVNTFYSRLSTERRHTKLMQEKNRRWSLMKVMKRFPGWTEVTVANLHSLFLLFDQRHCGMIDLEDFSAVLESLGDSSTSEIRKIRFEIADTDMDGVITYDEYLSLMYNYDPRENDELVGVAKLCYDVAESIRFVSNLSLGEQLEYGLF